MSTKPKIVFAPGFLESCEGTQEEFDKMLEEIQSIIENSDEELECTVGEIDPDDVPDDVPDDFDVDDVLVKYYPYMSRTLH